MYDPDNKRIKVAFDDGSIVLGLGIWLNEPLANLRATRKSDTVSLAQVCAPGKVGSPCLPLVCADRGGHAGPALTK